MNPHPTAPVLVVGAGPAGLTVAAWLRAYDVPVRIVERRVALARPSRAVVVHPRTLELLRPLGVVDALIDRGDARASLHLHLGGRPVVARMHDLALPDTAYPFLLFLPQNELETVLSEHLAAHGVHVERGVELLRLAQDPDGVTVTLRDEGGVESEARASYVVGCDGADSTVRELAGVGFPGRDYRRPLLVADVDVDGLAPHAAHAYLSRDGLLFLFPLLGGGGGTSSPMHGHAHRGGAPWRLIVTPPVDGTALPLQRLVDRFTHGGVTVRESVEPEVVTLRRCHASTYLCKRIALAGDAAHVQSPAGAQGMNTGIADACDLGWRLGLVVRGQGRERLLREYAAERRVAVRRTLRLTHLALAVESSANPLMALARAQARWVAPLLLLRGRVPAPVARVIGQLGVHYPVPLTALRPRWPLRPVLAPGHRLPDGPARVDEVPGRVHDVLANAYAFHLVAVDGALDREVAARMATRRPGLVDAHEVRMLPGRRGRRDGEPPGPTYVLVRPDGYVATVGTWTAAEAALEHALTS